MKKWLPDRGVGKIKGGNGHEYVGGDKDETHEVNVAIKDQLSVLIEDVANPNDYMPCVFAFQHAIKVMESVLRASDITQTGRFITPKATFRVLLHFCSVLSFHTIFGGLRHIKLCSLHFGLILQTLFIDTSAI